MKKHTINPEYLKNFSEANIPTNINDWLNLVEKSIKAELSWQKMTINSLKEYILTINSFLKTKHNACLACGSFMRKIHSDFQVALWKYAQKYIPMFIIPLPEFKSAKLNGVFWQNQIPILSFEMLQNQIDLLLNDSARERKKNPQLSSELNADAVALRVYKKAKIEYFSSENYNLLMWAAEKKDEQLSQLTNADGYDETNEKVLDITTNEPPQITGDTPIIDEIQQIAAPIEVNTEHTEPKTKKRIKSNAKKVEIDKEKLEKLSNLGMTLQEIADILGVTPTAVFYAKGGTRKTKQKPIEDGQPTKSTEKED